MCLKLAPITKTHASLSHMKGLHRTIQHCRHILWACEYILLILKSKFWKIEILSISVNLKRPWCDQDNERNRMHYVEWCYVCLNPIGFTTKLIWLAWQICHKYPHYFHNRQILETPTAQHATLTPNSHCFIKEHLKIVIILQHMTLLKWANNTFLDAPLQHILGPPPHTRLSHHTTTKVLQCTVHGQLLKHLVWPK